MMGISPDPTLEQQRFLFDLFLKGGQSDDVLRAFNQKFNDQRQIRFVNRQRKIFEAARSALEPLLAQQNDPLLAERRGEHFKQLAATAAETILNIEDVELDEGERSSTKGEYLVRTASTYWNKEQLSSRLELNWFSVERTWFQNDCFTQHLKAEYPDLLSGSVVTTIEHNPLELIQALNLLANRGTFKGSCPGCQY